MLPFALVAIAVLVVALVALWIMFQRRSKQMASLQGHVREAEDRVRQLHSIEERYRGILDLDAEQQRLAQENTALATHIQQSKQHAADEQHRLDAAVTELRKELAFLEGEAYFESFGLYQPRYDFDTSEKYRQKLEAIRSDQRAMTKDGKAAVCHVQWNVEGSAAKGRKMTEEYNKLLLRAFNGECDAAVAKVKYNNVAALEQRIRKAHESINKLGKMQRSEISLPYLDLKLQELYLFHEYQEKIQAEKEEQRRIQEQMREEQRVLVEIERARKEAEQDEKRYQQALDKARNEVAKVSGEKQALLQQQIEELQRRVAEAQQNKERAISRAQQTRSGHVYVISNLGSFGEHVYKIGLTRRLDPMERIHELGDASVPFSFDVHAVIFSEDAPSLETELHRQFHHLRVNKINERKEFFRVPLSEIEAVVRARHAQIEFTLAAEAVEYRQSLAIEQARERGEVVQVPGRSARRAGSGRGAVPALVNKDA